VETALWIAIMMSCRRRSTSSRVQLVVLGVLGHLQAEVATPPALAALPGPYMILLARKTSMPSGSVACSPFGDQLASVLDQRLGVVALISFWVADGNAQSHLTPTGGRHPCTRPLVLVGVLLDAAAADVLEIQHPGQLLSVDARRIIDRAVRVDSVTHLPPSWLTFSTVYWATLPEPTRCRSCRASSRCGWRAFPRRSRPLRSRWPRPDQRTAPVQGLAGQHAGELVADALVLAEEVADLAAADADVPRRDVGMRADVLAELGHEALAELITSLSDLPFGSKSEPPLPPPMGRVVSEF